MKIWTLTIDDDDGVSTQVFWTESEALLALRADLKDHNGDEVDDVKDEGLIDYATEKGGLVLYLDQHELNGRAYTLAEIRNGTGWTSGARFVQIPTWQEG